MSAADVIQSLHDDLAAAGVELRFAEVKDPGKDRLRRYELLKRLGPERFHPTAGDAVDAYVAESGVEWWESDEEPHPQPGDGDGVRPSRRRRATTRPVYRMATAALVPMSEPIMTSPG